jgi:hypothetical protein
MEHCKQCHLKLKLLMIEHDKVRALGLGHGPCTLQQLRQLGVKILVRKPVQSKIPTRRWLVDAGNEHLVSKKIEHTVVPQDDSWYMVREDESVIFVDKHRTCLTYAWLMPVDFVRNCASCSTAGQVQPET